MVEFFSEKFGILGKHSVVGGIGCAVMVGKLVIKKVFDIPKDKRYLGVLFYIKNYLARFWVGKGSNGISCGIGGAAKKEKDKQQA